MTIAVAIIADDLTGALDTAAPFAVRGLETAVAIGPEHIEHALSTDAEVIAVNTASRQAAADTAAEIVSRCARQMASARPIIAFKKVDSRLRGNVGSEVAAAMSAFGRRRSIVAPAVPEEGRVVIGGRVSGKGIDTSIAVRDRLGESAAAEIVDSSDWQSLQRVAAMIRSAPEVLAVGARGLGQAIAEAVAPTPENRVAQPFRAPLPAMIAIGSRDPITLRQIANLEGNRPSVAIEAAANGHLPARRIASSEVLVLQCVDGDQRESETEVARRFADTVLERAAEFRPATLLLSGGDTALAVLLAHGVKFVRPEGEAAPSIPYFRLREGFGSDLLVLTKSGGFGGPDTLRDILAEQS